MPPSPWVKNRWQNPAARTALLGAFLLVSMPAHAASRPDRVLVFTRTAEFRHDSIVLAIATLQRVASVEDMQADATEAAADFTPADLARCRVIVEAVYGDANVIAQRRQGRRDAARRSVRIGLRNHRPGRAQTKGPAFAGPSAIQTTGAAASIRTCS